MATPRRELPILFEDAHLIAIAKPAGLASVPSAGVKGATCLSDLQRMRPGVLAIHRLDRETSGVMIFAKSEEARAGMEARFRAREVDKVYVCLVRGMPKPPVGTISKPIADRGAQAEVARHGKPAVSRYRVLRRIGPVAMVEVKPETGRYNQIRLHFAAIRHPLIGERKYARGGEAPVRFRRVALHARSLKFEHPVTGKPLTVRAQLPQDLLGLIAQLEKEER